MRKDKPASLKGNNALKPLDTRKNKCMKRSPNAFMTTRELVMELMRPVSKAGQALIRNSKKKNTI